MKTVIKSIALILLVITSLLDAKQMIDLTLEKSVDIAMNNSYRIRQLKLGIKRTRYWLQAEQAGLKSKLYMNVAAPEYKNMSDYKWNSLIQKDEIVHLNTQKWEVNLSLKQPVILLGYPTNGYLSLNNRTYQYIQTDGYRDVSYYNRFFVKYEQPFFQPNTLKNNLEKAELNVERRELEYIDDQVDMIEDIGDDYYDLFKLAYANNIYENKINNLEKIGKILETIPDEKPEKEIDVITLRVELNNAKENLLQNQSRLRLEMDRMKQRLRLDSQDSLLINPAIDLKPIQVNLEEAIKYGETLRPSMRMLNIDKRHREIDLKNVKGWNAFHMNLTMTYGIEKQEDNYRSLWEEFDNSNSVVLNAYIPLWDWGQRKARIEAQKITIQKTDLYMEERLNSIKLQITTSVKNLKEYERRALTMKDNMEMANELSELNIINYKNDKISLQDLIQTINSQTETEFNFLDTYLGYRNSILNLTVDTYYDYENDVKLLDKFRSQG